MDPKWTPQSFPRRTPRGPQDDWKSLKNGTPLGAPLDPKTEPNMDLKIESKWVPEGTPKSSKKAPQKGSQNDRYRGAKTASAPGGLRGAIPEPFWPHFGASGGRFSSLRRLIFERPGGNV